MWRTLPLLLLACQPAAESDAVTYNRDVYPIVAEHCLGCHIEGGIAPMSYEDADVASSYGVEMLAQVEAGTMPPFLPGGASPELMNDPRLDADELDTLRAWVEGGSPAGDDADRADLEPTAGFDMGRPADLAFDIGVDYVPDASVDDDYRCFLVPLHNPDAHSLVAVRVTPSDLSIAHHVIVTLFAGDDETALQQLDDDADGGGWPCFGGPTDGELVAPVGSGGGWVPGLDGRTSWPGTYAPFAEDVVAVVQVHYNNANGPGQDRTAIEYWFDDETPDLERVSSLKLRSRDIDIPADSSDTVVEVTLGVDELTPVFYPDGDGYAVGVQGHGHLLMTSLQIVLDEDSDQEQVLLDIPRWDFHWQDSWLLVNPIRLTETDTLTLRCTYDNTEEYRRAVGADSESVDVTWGEGTADEMCLGGIAVVDDVPGT